MYRPEGWDNSYNIALEKSGWGEPESYGFEEGYEAGADAMLEGLKKHVSAGHTDGTTKEYTVQNFDGVAGTFVFIPEGDNEK